VGDNRYDPQYDVNHDGVINLLDAIVVLKTPTCTSSTTDDDESGGESGG